jgi:hypothetical protein
VHHHADPAGTAKPHLRAKSHLLGFANTPKPHLPAKSCPRHQPTSRANRVPGGV